LAIIMEQVPVEILQNIILHKLFTRIILRLLLSILSSDSIQTTFS